MIRHPTEEGRAPAPWQSLLTQLEEELKGELPAERADTLRCQLALLRWDLGASGEAAAATLAGCAPDHPLATELRRQLLIDAADIEGATDLLEEQAGRLLAGAGDRERAAHLLHEAARLQLFWAKDAARAAELCQQAIDAGHPGDLTELLELSLDTADEIERLATRALNEDLVTLPTLVSGALALWDRIGRPELALDLLLRAHDLDGGDPFILELLLEASVRFPEVVDRARFVERKHALLERQHGTSPEALAVAFELCRRANADGDGERAEGLWTRIADAVGITDGRELRVGDTVLTARVEASPESPASAQTTPPDGPSAGSATDDTAEGEADTTRQRWATLALASLRRDIALQLGDREGLAEAYLAMAELSGVPAFARVYRLRAAQLGERAGCFDVALLEQLLELNLAESHSDLHTAEMLQRLHLRHGHSARLCGLYQTLAARDGDRRGQLLRWAAILAEADLADDALAASLRRDAVRASPDAFGAGDLQRLYRRSGATDRLREAYQRQVDTSADPATLNLLCLALAAWQLVEGDLTRAASHAEEALAVSEEDLAALLLLAEIQRLAENSEGLRQTLTRLLELLGAPANQQACLRKLAALEHDAELACRHLERARALAPEDPSTLRALAARLREAGASERAAAVLGELGRLAVDPEDAASVHREAGQLALDAGDEALALDAFLAVVNVAPGDEEALTQLEALYSARGNRQGLLDTLRQQLTVEQPPTARARLLLKVGQILAAAEASAEECLAPLTEAARLDPALDDALVALARCCRVHQRWQHLAAVLDELPGRVLVLDLRAEALEQLGEIDALLAVRSRLLALAAAGRDRADRAYDLGRAHELRREIDDALEAYRRGVAEAADHRPSLRALQRIYQASGRHDELERVLEQELGAEEDPHRQVDLLLDLARCTAERRNSRLAIEHLERAFELAPEHHDVIDGLERLYEGHRPLDHARLLEHRAQLEGRGPLRSALHQRAAEIWAAHDAEEEANAAFRAALRVQIGNREAFTAYEHFCYERERWRELMEVYEAATDSIEEGGERVYRLSDLYARRGQLQLEQLGQPGEAVASFLKVLEYDPKSVTAMAALQKIFVSQRDWRGLIAAHEHRARHMPDNPLFQLEALRQAARIATSRLPAMDPDTARLWAEVHEADPDDDEALGRLEQLHELHGEHGKLADLVERNLARDPEPTIEGYLRLAVLAERRLEDPDRAARAYESVRAISEHHEGALSELARIYEATKQWQRCLEVLRDQVMIEADPEERSLLYFKIGSITEARFADDDGAIEAYQSSLNESPGCLPAIHGLRDVYLRRGDWFDALRTLEHELRLWDGEREEAGVLARMAEIRLRYLQQRDKAREELEDALALDKDCRPALTALFEIYYEDNAPAKALELSERLAPVLAHEGDPDQRALFFARRGELLADAAGDDDLDQLGLAADSLITSLRLRPSDLTTLERLIDLFRRSPESYDYASGFRELEQLCRDEGDARAVGHVLVAAGALSEAAHDVDAALELYQQAAEAAPESFAPMRARAHALVRIRRTDEAVSGLEEFATRCGDQPARLEAMAMLASLEAELLGEPERAAQRCAEVLSLDPTRHDTTMLLAQELYLLGRFDDARRTVEQLISDVGDRVSDVERARYHHYLGVTMLKTHGEAEGSACFRRALQLDPACAEAAMALARQLSLGGARGRAEELLTHSIHEASRRRGARSGGLLDLRRSLCGLYLGDGRFDDALAEYQTIIDDGGGQVEDHLTVAGIHALEDTTLPLAVAELQQVLADDPLNPHAFNMMAQIYDRQGEMDRTMQVLQVSELLGVISDEDRARAAQLRRQLAWKPGHGVDERLRPLVRAEAQDSYVERMWAIARDSLERVFPLELSGPRPQPADQAGDANFRLMVRQCLQLTKTKAHVLVADAVAGGVVSDNSSERVLIDRALLDQPLPAIAFGLGRSLELLRSGHALIGRLAFDDRLLLIELLSDLLEPAEERSDLAEEFIRRLPRKAAALLEDTAASYQQQLALTGQPQLAQRWFAAVEQGANHMGLISCDDIGMALRMMALLSHQEQAVGADGTVEVRALPDAPELIHYYLSDRYVRLRRRLAA